MRMVQCCRKVGAQLKKTGILSVSMCVHAPNIFDRRARTRPDRCMASTAEFDYKLPSKLKEASRNVKSTNEREKNSQPSESLMNYAPASQTNVRALTFLCAVQTKKYHDFSVVADKELMVYYFQSIFVGPTQ